MYFNAPYNAAEPDAYRCTSTGADARLSKSAAAHDIVNYSNLCSAKLGSWYRNRHPAAFVMNSRLSALRPL